MTIFTTPIKNRLAELIGENFESLYPDSKKGDANKSAAQAWTRITDALNEQFKSDLKKGALTEKQVQEKAKKMKMDAKQDFQARKQVDFVFVNFTVNAPVFLS
jgi:hypothetical protein